VPWDEDYIIRDEGLRGVVIPELWAEEGNGYLKEAV